MEKSKVGHFIHHYWPDSFIPRLSLWLCAFFFFFFSLLSSCFLLDWSGGKKLTGYGFSLKVLCRRNLTGCGFVSSPGFSQTHNAIHVCEPYIPIVLISKILLLANESLGFQTGVLLQLYTINANQWFLTPNTPAIPLRAVPAETSPCLSRDEEGINSRTGNPVNICKYYPDLWYNTPWTGKHHKLVKLPTAHIYTPPIFPIHNFSLSPAIVVQPPGLTFPQLGAICVS